MKAAALVITILFGATLARADRFVMKDNSVRIGKLTGMEGGNFVINAQGRVERIPSTSVSLVVLDETNPPAPVVSQTAPPQTSRPTGGTIFDPVAPIVSASSQTVEGFRIDLDRCTKTGTKSVTCSFKMTNLEADRTIRLHVENYSGVVRSYYVDDAGMQQFGNSARLGSQSGSHADTVSVTDVSVSGSIEFPGVASGVTSLAKLTISFYLPSGNKHFSSEFRKIPLQGN